MIAQALFYLTVFPEFFKTLAASSRECPNIFTPAICAIKSDSFTLEHERKTDKGRHRHRDRQTDRQTERQTDR